jgi:hypothetical protein
MKLIIAFLSLGCLTACRNSSAPVSFPTVAPELKDCKFFRLRNEIGDVIVVARCPNSTTSTTYPAGKTQRTAVVIDGVTYEPKEEK